LFHFIDLDGCRCSLILGLILCVRIIIVDLSYNIFYPFQFNIIFEHCAILCNAAELCIIFVLILPELLKLRLFVLANVNVFFCQFLKHFKSNWIYIMFFFFFLQQQHVKIRHNKHPPNVSNYYFQFNCKSNHFLMEALYIKCHGVFYLYIYI